MSEVPKKRWRSQKKKREAVVGHIKALLKSGPKTFDQLFEPLENQGISDHYLSDVLRDLLLWEKKIEQKQELDDYGEEKERVYLWRQTE